MIIETRFPYQNNYVIETDSNTFWNRFKAKYGAYAVEIPCGKKVDCSVMQKDGSYAFTYRDKTIETSMPLLEIDRLFFTSVRYDDRVFALHGAAVEYNRSAYLFLGSTTAGKTTLTSYLVERGFGYLTDDCILLDKKEFSVHPFTTPVCLREGGLAVFKKLGKEPANLHRVNEESQFDRWVYTPANAVNQPIPLKRTFFISRNESVNSTEPLGTNERLSQLMESPITPYAFSAEYLQFLIQLSKKNICKLNYCDMEFVREIICHGAE